MGPWTRRMSSFYVAKLKTQKEIAKKFIAFGFRKHFYIKAIKRYSIRVVKTRSLNLLIALVYGRVSAISNI